MIYSGNLYPYYTKDSFDKTLTLSERFLLVLLILFISKLNAIISFEIIAFTQFLFIFISTTLVKNINNFKISYIPYLLSFLTHLLCLLHKLFF